MPSPRPGPDRRPGGRPPARPGMGRAGPPRRGATQPGCSAAAWPCSRAGTKQRSPPSAQPHWWFGWPRRWWASSTVGGFQRAPGAAGMAGGLAASARQPRQGAPTCWNGPLADPQHEQCGATRRPSVRAGVRCRRGGRAQRRNPRPGWSALPPAANLYRRPGARRRAEGRGPRASPRGPASSSPGASRSRRRRPTRRSTGNVWHPATAQARPPSGDLPTSGRSPLGWVRRRGGQASGPSSLRRSASEMIPTSRSPSSTTSSRSS